MVPFLVIAVLLEGSSAVRLSPNLDLYTTVSLYDLCSGPGLTLDANGARSAVYIVAERPRVALRKKCSFSVRANNSDGVVISLQRMKLRPSTAVDGVCLDYIEFKGENGRVHTTSCGLGVKSYDMPVPLTVNLFTNPTQFYTPGEIISFFLTGYNKTTQEDCRGGSFTCSNARCIWEGFACDAVDNCGDISDEKYFLSSMCLMPMTALVLIVSGILIIVTSLLMMCYCMARLRAQLKRALEEERALRARKHESGSEGPYSEFVDTYGSMMPPRQQPFSSSVFQSGDQAGLRSRRLSSMPRAVSY